MITEQQQEEQGIDLNEDRMQLTHYPEEDVLGDNSDKKPQQKKDMSMNNSQRVAGRMK